MFTFESVLYVVPGPMQVADIPAEVVAEWLPAYGKRCLYQLDNGKPYHGGFVHNGRGGYFIIVSKQARAVVKAKPGSTVRMTIMPDTSEFGCDMPDEFAEVLATDPEADDAFRALTPGRQRTLIYIVAGVKSADKRIERALRVAEALKIGQTDPRKILAKKTV